MKAVPPYTEPASYEVDGSWERNGKREEHSITARPDSTLPPETYHFAVRDDYEILTVEVLDEPPARAFWTIVHYCRDYGLPGVWKEKLIIDGESFRLGALYCMGPFELGERETNYYEYGESPYEMEN